MICIALLLNMSIQNDLRQLAYDFNKNYNLPLTSAMLPQHITLKIAFNHDDLEEVATYVENLSETMKPFEVELTELQLMPMPLLEGGTGLIWSDIKESKILRKLHQRINHELEDQLGVLTAKLDGDAFQFHSTICIGGQTFETYQKAFSEIPNKKLNCLTTISRIALLYSPEKKFVPGKNICYRIFDFKV